MNYKHTGISNTVGCEEVTKDRKDEGVFGDQDNS